MKTTGWKGQREGPGKGQRCSMLFRMGGPCGDGVYLWGRRFSFLPPTSTVTLVICTASSEPGLEVDTHSPCPRCLTRVIQAPQVSRKLLGRRGLKYPDKVGRPYVLPACRSMTELLQLFCTIPFTRPLASDDQGSPSLGPTPISPGHPT